MLESWVPHQHSSPLEAEWKKAGAATAGQQDWMDKPICDRLGLKRGKRSEKNGARPYASEQAVETRAIFNKDRELLAQPIKVGDMVLSKGQVCELTAIGEGLCGNEGPSCVSTSGLRDLPSMRSGSRLYGSNLVALVMAKVRGMASEPWQNQR